MKMNCNSIIVRDNFYIYNMNIKTRQVEPNPFKSGFAGEVWNDLLLKSKTISRTEAQKKMKQAATLQSTKQNNS